MQNAIEVKNLKVVFPDRGRMIRAVEGVDLTVKKGECLALVGESGCGKSMTLRCIAGIVKPDRGRIVLDGRVLFDSAQHIDLPPQQRGVGLLFQNYALFPNMTVEQNILCGLKTEKDPAARRAACAEMLRAMRLETLAKRYPAQLSGGQQQRAAIARALITRPAVVLADEPTGALDYNTSKEILKLIETVNQKYSTTIIMVTHNEAIKDMADKVVKLRDGMIRRVIENDRKLTADELDW